MNLEKLKIIAKAKFSNKDNLGDWYTKRLEVCKVCPMNHKNKESLTAKELTMVTLNLGKDTCTACGCETFAKASVRSEQCGLVKIGQEPLWEALPEIQEVGFRDFKVENLSSDLVTVSVSNGLELRYRDLNFKEQSKITISFEDLTKQITSFSVKAGCGCTTTSSEKVGNKFYVDIEYNTNNLGYFEKSIVIETMREDLQKNYHTGKIIGTVNK